MYHRTKYFLPLDLFLSTLMLLQADSVPAMVARMLGETRATTLPPEALETLTSGPFHRASPPPPSARPSGQVAGVKARGPQGEAAARRQGAEEGGTCEADAVRLPPPLLDLAAVAGGNDVAERGCLPAADQAAGALFDRMEHGTLEGNPVSEAAAPMIEECVVSQATE